jgi:phospholipid/cholesterol/gamma-HCH transport system substrate-binding protein
MANRSKAALTWTELRVGLVVILSLAVLAFSILYIGSGGGSPFAKRYTVKALMSDVNGLKAGAPVRVGGVEVGTVTHVDFAGRGGGGMVEVSMRLDKKVQPRVTTESRVTLGSLGLLGEKAVDIAGSSEGAAIEDGGYLTAAAEDPMKDLMGDASESTAHLRRILSRMDAGEGLIGKALRDEELYTRMADVSERLQKMMGKLESQEGPLGRLFNDKDLSRQLASSARGVDQIVTRIEAGKGTLGVLTQDDRLARQMQDAASRLSEVAERLQRGEGTAGRLIQDDSLYRRLDSVTARLDALVARVEKGEGSAGKLVQDPELYDNFNASAKELRALFAEIRKDPRKYLHLKLSLF